MMESRVKGASRSRAVREVQSGLNQLIRGLRMLAREIMKEAGRAGRVRSTRVSPGRRLHGRYIGLIRNLPARQKAQVRALRAKKGAEAAIKMALEMRRSR
jgi:hypothetical protein